jgi:ferrous iron transport protein A
MMPLTLADTGDEKTVIRVGGKPDTRQFLESLGFVSGAAVTIVSELGGNVIVKMKDSRIAISKEMAAKIMV